MQKCIIKTSCLVAIILLTVGCSKNKTTINRSFCYWDTFFKLDTALLRQNNVNHFYIRYFDVDWDASSGMAKPIASISSNDSIPCNFTPSVYISNTVFERIDKAGMDSLAKRIKRRIVRLTKDFALYAYYRREKQQYNDTIRRKVESDFQRRYTDVLIDCDWTKTTREKFFYFVEQIKREFPEKEIELTLRLWQYRRTDIAGVPPVNRCLLMCYNMETANDYSVVNSIASIETLKKYVVGKQYPLKLDIALPIFSWAVLFRNEKSVGLIGNVNENMFENNLAEYKKLEMGKYMLLVDKPIGTYFGRRGDVVRVETISAKLLSQMADLLKQHIATDSLTRVTFFSWNSFNINNITSNEINKTYSVFGR